MIDKKIFEKYKLSEEKLTAFGFKKVEDKFIYERQISSGEFTARFTIDGKKEVRVDVFDNSTNDILPLFYIPSASGEFINEINAECESVTKEILSSCFVREVFKSEVSKKVIAYVKQKYGDELEFLWEKFDDNAIWRRKDTKKWYAVIMTITEDKLDIGGTQKIEIIDLRIDKSKPSPVDHKTIFPAYHMNKKSWITVCMDNRLPLEKIYSLIDESYLLATK